MREKLKDVDSVKKKIVVFNQKGKAGSFYLLQKG